MDINNIIHTYFTE